MPRTATVDLAQRLRILALHRPAGRCYRLFEIDIGTDCLFDLLLPTTSIIDSASGERLDAAALSLRIAERADALRASGVRPGSRVALIRDTSVDYFVDLLAIWRCDAIAACLDPTLSPPETANVLRFLRPVATIRSDEVEAGTAESGPADRAGDPDRPALILFTSGTTGEPKGVVLGRRALEARLSLNRMAIGDEALAASLLTLPPHFGHGLLGGALTPLHAGGTLVLAARGLGLAAKLGALVDGFGITFATSVPAFWGMAAKLSKPPREGTLRRVHVGSAPLSPALAASLSRWANCPVVNCYGMTETANWFAGEAVTGETPAGAVGKPWGGSAAVLTADGLLAATGDGEIVVRAPSMMSGYLDRPDLTAAAFVDGWYRTGDTGTVDGSARILLTGRQKEEINRGGFKVQPADVDRVVEAHPAVAEACTFGLVDKAGGEIVAIAIRLEPEAEGHAADLKAWCSSRLRAEAIPERWHFVHELPRNQRGKLSRAHVARMVSGED